MNSDWRHQMAASITIDTREFSRTANELIGALKAGNKPKSPMEVMERIARNLLKECVKFTPPFTERTGQESFAAQKRAGDAAVRREVTGLFRPFKEFDAEREAKSVETFVREGSKFFNLPQNAALRTRMLGYIAAGDWSKVNAVLDDTGQHLSSVVPDATRALHREARDRRGRVRASALKRPYYVENEKSIVALLRERLAKVGFAKSGWKRAAAGLKLSLPNWIARHNGAGEFQKSGTNQWPRIVLGNSVGYIQASGAELRIMQRAIANATYKLKKELEAVLAYHARKASGRRR